MPNLMREQVEEWLDDNPDFFFDYFLRKTELSAINAWLLTHGFSSVTRFVPPDIDDKGPFAVSFRRALARFLAGAPSSSNLKAHELLFGIGQNTTNSKASLRQEFAKSKSRSMFKTHEPSTSEPSGSRRNSLKDMRNLRPNLCPGCDCTAEFAPRESTVYRFDPAVHIHSRKTLLYPVYSSYCYRYTSLPPTTVSMLSVLIESKVKLPKGFPFHGKAIKKNMRQSKGENTFFLSIVRDIATELDVANLSVKAVENLAVLLNSDGASLYLIENRRGGRALVSRYVHVRDSSESSDRAGESDGSEAGETREIVVPWGVGILGYVAESGETVNVKSACQDPRFDKQVDKIMGFRTESLLCMPVRNAYDEIIAVVQIVNKNKTVDGGCFTDSDISTLTTYLQFIGIAITNAQIMDASRQEYERNRNLLEVVHDLFEEQTSLEKVMVKIMQRAQKLIECQKAAILLLEDTAENSTYARLFELAANSNSSEEQTPQEKERARAVTRYLVGVAEKVVASGQLLNIAEVLDVEKGHEGIIQNLLAMPIRNSRCQIIGVANVLDKEGEVPFDDNDEQLFEAFTIFCGLGIHNTLMFNEIQKAMARQKVALEVLSYHASASTKEVEGLVKEPIPCADDFNLYSLTFDDFSLDPDEMVKAAASMFLQLNLVKRFAIEKDTLYRFLVSVKKNYRDVPYHNWRHAFNVSQFMFAILMGCDMKDTFSELEVLGMFVGCLCHDLDHRGTNNAFQQKSGSPLVLLYGTTNTMEHHHFNHAVMILSAESNNIFSGLLPEEYSKVMEILKHSILSTDLSMYFQNRDRFFELVKTRTYSWELDDHRELLISMLMTASDLAASCKPWEVQRRVAQLVTSEFFEQGDKERDELHLTPQPLMDRERRHELPQLQIGWMTDICIPLYDSLGEMNPKMSPICEGAIENRKQWQRIVDGEDTMIWDLNEENPKHSSSLYFGTTRLTVWYPRGARRPLKRPKLRWEDELKKLGGRSRTRMAQDREFWQKKKQIFI